MISAFILTLAVLAWGGGQADSSTQNQPGEQSASTPLHVCGPQHAPSAGPCATPPQVITSPSPKYSKIARAAKRQGTSVLWLIVGTDGKPHDIRVARPLGMGLDENAIKAVQNWKFKPGEYQGKPVPAQINVQVNFRLY